jgi:hypothetical protein
VVLGTLPRLVDEAESTRAAPWRIVLSGAFPRRRGDWHGSEGRRASLHDPAGHSWVVVTKRHFHPGTIWRRADLVLLQTARLVAVPVPGATSRSSFALLMLAVLPALMLSMSPVLILHRLMQGSSRWKLPRAAAPRRPMRRTCAFLYSARPSCTVLNQPCWALALGRTMEIPMEVVAGRGTSDQPGNIDHPMQRCHSLSEPPSGLSARVC